MTTFNWTMQQHYDGTGKVMFDDVAETVTVDAFGTGDFWATSDGGSLIYRPYIRGEEVVAKLITPQPVLGAHQRLAMLRSSAASNARMFVFLLDSDHSHSSLVFRDTDGAAAVYAGDNFGPAYDGTKPLWIKLKYDGMTAQAWMSQDLGTSYALVGSRAMTGLSLFCLLSGGNTGIVANTFDNHAGDLQMVVEKRISPETPYPVVDRRSWIKKVA